MRAANPMEADWPAGGWPPKGRIVMTPLLPPNYYPFSVPLIMELTQSKTAYHTHTLPVSVGQPHPLSKTRCRPATSILCYTMRTCHTHRLPHPAKLPHPSSATPWGPATPILCHTMRTRSRIFHLEAWISLDHQGISLLDHNSSRKTSYESIKKGFYSCSLFTKSKEGVGHFGKEFFS
jgi:hypothetical protein